MRAEPPPPDGKGEPAEDGSVLVEPLGIRFATGDDDVLVDGVTMHL